MKDAALARCQQVFPSWRALTGEDFVIDEPKGFSSFTMGIRAKPDVDPPAVLYRHLAGKQNSILDFVTERETFLLLADHEIAARCHHYDETCRIEQFYTGRTLTAAEVLEPAIQRGIADELFRLHQLEPENLPERTFFELLHERWGDMARSVLSEHRHRFPSHEQAMCADLRAIHSDEVLTMVLRCLPEREPVFCHNDTYHGNVMLLDDGRIKLLDFEFSCLNHIAFDVANLFAETVMVHGIEEPPHFRIDEPRFTRTDLESFAGLYIANAELATTAARNAAVTTLVAETERALLLSDFMYAMAALPLALEPIQRIRFIPYAHQRFTKFLEAWNEVFGH